MTQMTTVWEYPTLVHLLRHHIDANEFTMISRSFNAVQIGLGSHLWIRARDADGKLFRLEGQDALPHALSAIVEVVIGSSTPVEEITIVDPADADDRNDAEATVLGAREHLSDPGVPDSAVLEPDADATVLGVRRVGVDADETVLSVHRSNPDAESDADATVLGFSPSAEDVDATVLGPRRAHPGISLGNATSEVDHTVLGMRMPAQAGEHAVDISLPVAFALIIESQGRSQSYQLATSAIIGRAPSRPRDPEYRDALLVSVAGRRSGISSNHVQFRREGPHVLVRDLWTSNGTIIVPASGTPYRLRSGDEVPLPTDARVDLGDDIIIRIGVLDHGA
ncbi:hypothetical protein M2390_001871 [Mycetocola sp. BIGb0189]|uniref:FHA domain-containing protein n=1 Tax=Mycetocola sp. BIGb0189 TaxID=2940604 RepID=UPI00216859ED|nr:FHA domain-containing protein [Mycetocola sp. BIGb0189]MCS4276677.1 hypothetical protein [Mycetocola sp. BIGb0189]